MQRRSLPAVLALATAAMVGVAACGSSSSDTATSAGSSSAATSGDQVTAVPAITPASGIQTGVDLDSGLVSALTSLKVTPSAFGSATLTGTNIAFPITAGYATIHSDASAKPGYIQGTLAHDGSGITLTAGSTVVSLTNFVVDPGYSKLYGNLVVGGKTMATDVQVADLDGSPLKVTMGTGTVKLDGTIIKLTAGAASALNGAFNTTAVKAGTVFGVAHIVVPTTGAIKYPASVATAIPKLSGKATSVILNTSTIAALTSLGVSVAPFGSATLSQTPPTSTGNGSAPPTTGATVSFPITSGSVSILSDKSLKPGYVQGLVSHDGSGLTFSGAGKSVTVSDFQVDPGNSVVYATVGGKPGLKLLDLDGSAVQVRMNGSNPVLFGTVAKLSTDAAKALDSTFGTTALKGGEPVGVVSLEAVAGS